MKTILLIGICAGGVVSPSHAQPDDRPGDKVHHPSMAEEHGKMTRRNKGHEPDRPPSPDGMFKRMDANADGNISREEFFAHPRLERLPEEKRNVLFARLDKDSDGVLSFREIEEMRNESERRHREEFRQLDVDKSGGLSFEEFSKGEFFKKLPDGKKRQIFRRMDTNKDGQITEEDRPKGPPHKKKH
ncbi:EF-hand domain-containing protein [Luteolibacter algae]|uniref:EF-hand domain-containing protein n=1 Tax=Luteolibacter algae TaxID=454151 RepID=A0ABW5DB58_9BACT